MKDLLLDCKNDYDISKVFCDFFKSLKTVKSLRSVNVRISKDYNLDIEASVIVYLCNTSAFEKEFNESFESAIGDSIKSINARNYLESNDSQIVEIKFELDAKCVPGFQHIIDSVSAVNEVIKHNLKIAYQAELECKEFINNNPEYKTLKNEISKLQKDLKKLKKNLEVEAELIKKKAEENYLPIPEEHHKIYLHKRGFQLI
jgi:valyl-tRNA synthetase